MKTKAVTRVLAIALCLVMLLSAAPLTAFGYDASYESETHTVFRHTEQTLAPGVEYYNTYAYLNDGEQIVYYVATADISRDDVVVQTSYLNQYKDKQPGMSKLTEQIAFANEYYTDPENPLYLGENYTVVAGSNASFYNMQTGQPSGVCFVDGVDFGTDAYPAFFAILKDGTAIIDDRANKGSYTGEQAIWQAVGGSQWLVRNGADVTASSTGSYNTDRHSRTCVGVTADGKVVIMVLDGRQSPFSDGGSMHELAQIMLEAECVQAINLDGGGSTTFAARPEGEDSVRIINRPSDGSERSISSGLIIASLAVPSDVFERVNMTVADEYVTPGTSTEVSVVGVSPAGTSAEIPEELVYTVTNGSYADGVFTAGPNAGDAVITASYNGNTVGSAVVHVVIPERISFPSSTITVPYGKSAELEIIAEYGLNEVKNKAEDFVFTLENPAAGSFDGFTFTAGNDPAITQCGITAQMVGTELTAAATLSFGKGSEVIFDFEDGTTNGFGLSYSNYNYYLPRSKVFVATAENGQVHSGDYALGLNIDYSNSQEAGYQMLGLYQGKVSGNAHYYEDAQKLGAWLYIPDEYVGLWVRWTISPITEITEDENGNKSYTLGGINSNVMDNGAGGTGVVYSFDESGWHYLSCDLSTYKGLGWRDYYYCMQFYISDRDGASYGYYAKNQHNINGNFTVYLDDITVDYSTVVEDREAPVFSSVLLGDEGPHSNEAMVLNNGYVSEGYSKLAFSARVADNTSKANATGIDPASAKVYIDGNEVASSYVNGLITAKNEYDFTDGQHVVKFIVYDRQGNRASATRYFSVSANPSRAAVKLVPHDETLDRILHGSLYYVDLVATDAANVQTVTTTLNLDSMSKWELDHMIPSEGFEVSYELQEDDMIARITVTRTGSPAADNNVLVSIPIRSWELDNASKLGALNADKNWNYAEFKATKEFWPVAVEVRPEQGKVTYADGSTDYFTGENIFCWTESWANYANMTATQEGKDYHSAWNGGHDHRPEYAGYYADGTTNYHAPIVSKEAKAPSCTEAGWTEELYCDLCNSVVKWSEEIPALGHNFEMSAKKTYFIISDNGANQSPDLEFNGGIGYYYENGEYKSFETDSSTNVVTFTNSGNFANPTIYCWFQGEEGAVAWPGVPMEYVGQNEFDQAQFTYELPVDEALMRCTVCGELCNEEVNGLMYVEGRLANGWIEKSYYVDGVKLTGIQKVDELYYDFGEDGVSKGVYTGLVEIDGELFYSKLGALVSGWYDVDDTWMYFVPETMEAANGNVTTADGIPFDFVDGVPQDVYWQDYYGRTRCWYGPAYYHNTSKNVPYLQVEINGNTYFFNAAGLMALGMVETHNSNDFSVFYCYDCGTDGVAVPYSGGYNSKYYVNGIQQMGICLYEMDGSYFFLKSNNRTADTLDTSLVEGLTGIVFADGDVYYAENGPAVAKGLVTDGNGGYYFINSTKKAVKNTWYSFGDSAANGLLPGGTYYFGEDGKMQLKNGLYFESNGDIRYYENGEPVAKGLVTDGEGNYYFINSTKKAVKNTWYAFGEEAANGLMPAGKYWFGEDGRMQLKEGLYVEQNGDIRYYENGEPVAKGLVTDGNGNYYFINSTKKAVKNSWYAFSAEASNGLMAPGVYWFGEDGKMQLKEGLYFEKNGDIRYYENGEPVAKGLVTDGNGAYYFINSTKKAVKNTWYAFGEASANGLMPAGKYFFGADGKMVLD